MSLKVNHNRQASLNPEKITDRFISDNDLTKDQEPFLNQGQQQQQLSNSYQNKELPVKPKTFKLTEQVKQIYESHQNSTKGTQFQDQENATNVQMKISNSPEENEFMPDVERFKQRLQVNMTIQRYRDNVISNEDTPEFHKIKQQVSLQRIRKPKPPTFSQTSSRFFQTQHHKEEKDDRMQEMNNNDEELQSDQNNTSINGTLQFLKKDQAIEAVTDTQWTSARNAISRGLSIGLQQSQQESPGISQVPLQVRSLREILLPQMMVNESKSPMQSRLKLKVSPNNILQSSQTTSSSRNKQTSNQTPRKISNISQINMFAFNQEQDINRNSNSNSNPGSEGLIRSERNIHFTSRSDRKINTNISNSHLQLPSQFAQHYHKTREDFQLAKNLYSSTCLSKRADPDLSMSNLRQDSQDQQRNPQVKQNKTEQQDQIKQQELQQHTILIGKSQRLSTDNNDCISPFDIASPATPLNDTSLQFSWKNPLSTQLQDLLHPLNSSQQPTLPQKSRFIARQNNPRNGILTQGEISSTNKSHANESLNFSSAFDPQASYPTSCKVIPRSGDENNLKNGMSTLKPPGISQGNSHKMLITQNFRSSLSPSILKSNDPHKLSNNSPNQQQQQEEAPKRATQHSQHSQFRLLNRILQKKQSQNLPPARLSYDLSENGRQQQEQIIVNQQTQTMKKESQKSVDRALPFTNSLIKEKIKQLLQGGAFNRPLPAYQPSSKETYSQSGWQQQQQQQQKQPQPQPQQYQSKGSQSRMTPQPSRKQQLFLHSKSFKQITDERQPDIQTNSTQKLQILSVIHAHDNLEKINNTIGDFEDTLSPVDWKQRGFSQGRLGDRQSKTPMHQNFSMSRKLLKGFSGKIGLDTP